MLPLSLPLSGANMAYKAVILDEAQREYRQIVDYLARILCSPQAAAAFVDGFERILSLVVDDPQLFAVSQLRELAARGYRTAFVGNYAMLYRLEGDLVAVAHIFHQTQDYARLV